MPKYIDFADFQRELHVKADTHAKALAVAQAHAHAKANPNHLSPLENAAAKVFNHFFF